MADPLWLDYQRNLNRAVADLVDRVRVPMPSHWPVGMRHWAFLLALPLAPVWMPAAVAFGLLVAVAVLVDWFWAAPRKRRRFPAACGSDTGGGLPGLRPARRAGTHGVHRRAVGRSAMTCPRCGKPRRTIACMVGRTLYRWCPRCIALWPRKP